MSSNGKQSQRRNLHMEGSAGPAGTQIHLFTKNPTNKVLADLQQELSKKHYSFKLHNNPNELPEIIATTQERTVVLIDSTRQAHEIDTVFPKYYKFPYSNESLKLFTFPNKIVGSGLANLEKQREVLEECGRAFGTGSARIKLSSVHSIRGSREGKFTSSKSLHKATPGTVYENLFFFRDSDNDYGNLYDTAQYVELTACLEADRFKPYLSGKDLLGKEPPKTNKKYLLVGSTSERSLKVLQGLNKKKDSFDCVLMGVLQPKDYLLEDNIVLASQDPSKIILFLFENGFESTSLSALLLKFRSSSNEEGQQPQNGSEKGQPTKIVIVPPFQSAGQLTAFRSNSNNENIVNAFATVEAAPSKMEEEKGEEKKKIKRIRSPAKGRVKEEEKSEVQDNAINIIVSSHGIEPLKETEEYTVNKQGEKLPKINSFKRQDSIGSATRNNDTSFTTESKANPIPASAVSAGNVITGKANGTNPIAGYDAKVPTVGETHFLKKSTTLDSKYRNNPSTIIHEMSDEYRGSNKESIVNLQPEASYRMNKNSISNSQQDQNQPLQEKAPKRIVNTIQYSNAPDSYYYARTSENHIDDKPAAVNYVQTSERSNTAYNNNNIGSTSINSANNVGSAANIGSANNISNNSIKYGANYQTSNTYQSPTTNYQSTANTYQSTANTYQSPYQPSPISYQSPTTYQSPTGYQSSTAYQSTSTYQSTSNTPITTIPATNYYNSPTVYTVGGQSRGIRTYGRVSDSYASPTKVIRKEQISAPEEYQADSKGEIENRITFGSNQLNVINGLNGSRPAASNPTATAPSTATATGTAETMRANSASYTSPNYSSNYYNVQTLNYHKLNNEPFNNRIEITSGKTNEVTTYASNTIQNEPTNNNTNNTNSNNNYMSPPKVEMKSTRTLVTSGINLEEYERIERDGRVVYKKKIQVQPKPTTVQSSAYSNQPSSPTVRRYEVSPVRQPHLFDPKRTDYRSSDSYDYSYRQKSEEVDNGLGEMIESSHKKREQGRAAVGGARIYGGPRVEVERVERMEPRVQACSPNNRPSLNESNMFFSRASELHSDGSILRRNNARFGIKRREERPDPSFSQAESGLGSGLLRLNELNKKMALNRVMEGEEYLKEEAERYRHINTALSNFHFLVEDSLTYLSQTIQDYLATAFDRTDHFTGSQQLLEKIQAYPQCEVGFILARNDQMVGINFSLLPDNYYFVQLIQEDEPTLEISEQSHRIKVDSLNQLPLAQKIILDSKLDQYVIYRGSNQEIERLANKFLNSEFIIDNIDCDFSAELIDSYYAQQPRLTRLYVLCNEGELPSLIQALQQYEVSNAWFRRGSCKLLCLLTNILNNDELILSQPQVTFISNPLEIETHRHLLAYAHHYDPRPALCIPAHHLFYHRAHSQLPQLLHQQFPGRFHLFPYTRLAEAQLKADRLSRSKADQRNYLVLHESVNGQAIRSELWSKVYMVGKAKVVQPKVIRVLDSQQLCELLRK